MRKTILSILVLLIACSKPKENCNYVSDYYPLTTKASLQFYLGNNKKAFDLYSKAFESCNAIKIGALHDTDTFAKVCASLGKSNLALDYIELTLKKGGTINTFLNDSIFNKILKTESGKKLLFNSDSIHSAYLNGLDLKLRSELQEMIALDQKYNSTKLQDSMFMANDSKLMEIFEEHGYPNEQMIGNYGVDQIMADPAILLLHTMDSSRIHYFIPKIKQFVQNGTCPPLVLGTLYDNLELFNGKPQTYGTYKNQDGGYAKMISNLGEVDDNRISIGLPSLEITRKLDSLRFKF